MGLAQDHSLKVSDMSVYRCATLAVHVASISEPWPRPTVTMNHSETLQSHEGEGRRSPSK